MLLTYADGSPFATGAIPYNNAPGTEQATRVIVEVEINGQLTTAIIDTGMPCSTCSASFASLIGLASDSLESAPENLDIRGRTVSGRMHRADVDFMADAGEYLPVNVPLFVPNTLSDITFEDMRYLGMYGCLDMMRFAFDSIRQVFYFA